MSNRYDLLVAREKDGRSYFTKIGVMFPNRSGEGFTCFFEALPLPGPEGCKVIVKPADSGSNGNHRQSNNRQTEDVPF